MSTDETAAKTSADPPDGAEPSGISRSPRPGADRPEVLALRRAKDEESTVTGRVIGWNRGGFHVVIEAVTAFCPRSEMELGHPRSPRFYLDKDFSFRVLKVQKRGRRVVLSRAAVLRDERAKLRAQIREKLEAGTELEGTVASLTEFGAFVDLGGVQGLVHVSEISHQRVAQPADVLSVGQKVKVKVLSIEKGGKRISLSMRALEPSPWRDLKKSFPVGTILSGKVEKVTRHGAFVELQPGLTGLLPTSSMTLPREASPARAYPPGRVVRVQVVAVDERRQRISLAPEGSTLEGTRHDYQLYLRHQEKDEQPRFHALADALKKARSEAK